MMKNASDDDMKLSRLIEDKVTSIQTETKCEKANQIRNAIEIHLKTWLDEVEKLNPLFKVSELIQVGSYAEGTKIIEPDEFDFLAVIKDLSLPTSVLIDKHESDFKHSLVRVAVADDRLKSRWSMLCKDGHLQCFQRINFPDLCEYRFGHVFISAVRKKKNYGKRLGTFMAGTPIDLACKLLLPTVNNISLILTSVFYWVPNVLLHFKLGNKDITVDLSPAIRYHTIEDCFKEEDCAGKTFAELVLNRKSLLLIGTKTDFDFKVTVTEAEVQYMQSVMKPEHKIIYIFLKYIENIYTPDGFPISKLTSYMLKSVCIRHDIKCKTEDRTISECLKSVIGELEECARQGYVTSVVNKHVTFHLYGFPNFSAFLEKLKDDRKFVHNSMKKLYQLPKTINTVEYFGAYLKQLFQQQKQRGNEEQDDTFKRPQQLDQVNHPAQSTTHLSKLSSTQSEKSQSVQQNDEEAVARIVEMGFEPEEVRIAMRANNNDPNNAVDYLLKGIAKCDKDELHLQSIDTTAIKPLDTTNMDVEEPRHSVSSELTGLALYNPGQSVDHAQTFEFVESCRNLTGELTGMDHPQSMDIGEPLRSLLDPPRSADSGESSHIVSPGSLERSGLAQHDHGRTVYTGELTESSGQTVSDKHIVATREFEQSRALPHFSSNGHDMYTCEILYQRQKDV